MDAVVNLCDTRKTYTELVDILVSAWEKTASVIRKRSPDYTINILHWVLRHTLHIMLHSEWKDISEDKRNSIKDNVKKTLIEVPETSYSHYRCQYILNNIDNPWGSESFSKVINGDSEEVTDSDLEFLTSERGCMIVLRLQKLVQIKCYPAAFVLSSKAIKAYKQIDEHHRLRKSTSLHQYSYLFDLYLALLLKYGHLTEIVEEVKVLSSKQALQVVRRNLVTTGKCARLIKYHPRVARLAAEILLAKLMEEVIEESNESDYCDILKEWFMIHKDTEIFEFRTVAGKLFTTAKSKHHIYLACNVMKDMHIEQWRVILLELYVRGLTADLNELELLKAERDCDEHIVIHHETDLSYRYLFLAEILKDYIPLAQECVLTAFSLNPCLQNYERVKKIAEIGGKKDNSSVSTNTSTTVPDLNNQKLIEPTNLVDKDVENTNKLKQQNLGEINNTEVANAEINPKCQSTIESSISNGDIEVEISQKVVRTSLPALKETQERKQVIEAVAAKIDVVEIDSTETVVRVSSSPSTETEIVKQTSEAIASNIKVEINENLCRISSSQLTETEGEKQTNEAIVAENTVVEIGINDKVVSTSYSSLTEREVEKETEIDVLEVVTNEVVKTSSTPLTEIKVEKQTSEAVASETHITEVETNGKVVRTSSSPLRETEGEKTTCDAVASKIDVIEAKSNDKMARTSSSPLTQIDDGKQSSDAVALESEIYEEVIRTSSSQLTEIESGRETNEPVGSKINVVEVETDEKVVRMSSTPSKQIEEDKQTCEAIAPEIDVNTLDCVGEVTVEETVTDVINVLTDQKTENLCNVNQSEENTPVISDDTCKILEEYVCEDIASQKIIGNHEIHVDAIVNHEKFESDRDNQSDGGKIVEDIREVVENGIQHEEKIFTTESMEEPVDHEEIITTENVVELVPCSKDENNVSQTTNGVGASEITPTFSNIITIDDDIDSTSHVEHTVENGNIEVIVMNPDTVKELSTLPQKDPLAATNENDVSTTKEAQVGEQKIDETAQENLNSKVNIDALHSITNSNIPHLPNYDEFTAPSLIDTIDLPSEIRTDLLVLLQSPRVKLLSWVLPWTELERNCRKLLQKEVKLTLVRRSLAGANDYLQYLNLDYEQFKHLPEIEYPGIEKGYEMYSIDDDDDDDEDNSRRNSDSDMSDTSDSLYDYKGRRTKRNRRNLNRLRNKRMRQARRNVIRSSTEFDNYMSNEQDDESENEGEGSEVETENETQQFEQPNASSNETENQVPSPINVDLSLDSNSSILNIATYSDILSSPTRHSVKSDLEVRPRRKYIRRTYKSVSEGHNSSTELDFSQKLIENEKSFEELTPRTRSTSTRLLKRVTKDIKTRKLVLNNSVEQAKTRDLERSLTQKIMTTISGYNNADRKVYRKMALRAKRQKRKLLNEDDDVNYFSTSSTDSAPERYEVELRDYLIQYYSLRGTFVPRKADYSKYSSSRMVRRNHSGNTRNKLLQRKDNNQLDTDVLLEKLQKHVIPETETLSSTMAVDGKQIIPIANVESIDNLLDIEALDTSLVPEPDVSLLGQQSLDDLSNITEFPEIFPTDATNLPLNTSIAAVDPFADLVTEAASKWQDPTIPPIMSPELYVQSSTDLNSSIAGSSIEPELGHCHINKVDSNVKRYGSARNNKRKILKTQEIDVSSRKVGESDTDTTEHSLQSSKLSKPNYSNDQYDGNSLQISIDKAINDMNLSLALCESMPSDTLYDLMCNVDGHPAAPIRDVADIPKLMIDRSLPNIRILHQSEYVDNLTNVPILPTLSDTTKLSDKSNIDFSNNTEVAARINEIYNDALEVIGESFGSFNVENTSGIFDPTLPSTICKRAKICQISNIGSIADIDFIDPPATICDNTKICDTTDIANIDDIDFSEPILSETDTCFENDEKNLTNITDDDEICLNGQESSLNEDSEFVVQKPLRTYSRMGCNIKSNDTNHGVKKMCTPNAHTCGCVEDDRYISLPSTRSSSCSSLSSEKSSPSSSFSKDKDGTTNPKKKKLKKRNKKRRNNDGVIKDEIIDMVLDMEEDSRKKSSQVMQGDSTENPGDDEQAPKNTKADNQSTENPSTEQFTENAKADQAKVDPPIEGTEVEQSIIPVETAAKKLPIIDSTVDRTHVDSSIVNLAAEKDMLVSLPDVIEVNSSEEASEDEEEINLAVLRQKNANNKKKLMGSSSNEKDGAEPQNQANECVKLKIKFKNIMAPLPPKLKFPKIVLSRIDIKLAETKLNEFDLESGTEQEANKKEISVNDENGLVSSQQDVSKMEESQNTEQNKVVEKLVIKKNKTKDSFVTVTRACSEAPSPRPPIRLSLSLRRKNRHSTYYTNNTTYNSFTDTDNSCVDSNQFNESSNRFSATANGDVNINHISNSFHEAIVDLLSESSIESTDHTDSDDETFTCYVHPKKRKLLYKNRKQTRFGPKMSSVSPKQSTKQLSVNVRRVDNATLIKYKQPIFYKGILIPYAFVNVKKYKPNIVSTTVTVEENKPPTAPTPRPRGRPRKYPLTTITPALNNSLQNNITETTNDYEKFYNRSATPKIPPRSHTPITRRQSRLITRTPNFENIPDILPNNASDVRDEFKKVMPLLIHNSTSKTPTGNPRKRKNLEMFQISSDDDLELELDKKPAKLPRLEGEEKLDPPIVPRRIITRRRTVAYGSFSTPCAPPMPTHSIRNSNCNAKVSSRDPRLRPTTPSARPSTPFSIRLRDRCQINLNENTLMNKRNFMFDIYSVSVKSDFKQFDSLFKTINDDKFIFNNFRKNKNSNGDLKLHCKENNKNFENNLNNIKDKLLNSMNDSEKNSKKKLLSRVSRTSELIYEIAAKLICKSINEQSESELEKQKRIKRVLSNFFDYFIPEIWSKCRKYDKKIDLKKSFDIIEKPYPPDTINTKKIHSKNYEKPKFLDIISSIIQNMSNTGPNANVTERGENERLFNNTSDSDQIDESLNSIEETCLKCNNKSADPQQLRNLYCQAIKKYPNLLDLNDNSKSIFKKVSSNDRFIEQLNSTKNNKFSKPNKRLLMDLPGFKTLEHFTAPSFHCLPIVRIVHSTVALDNINASLSAQNVSMSKVEVSSSEPTATTGSSVTSTAPIENTEPNNKKRFENKTNVSKSMFVITTNSSNNSAEKAATNVNGSTNGDGKTVTLNNNINIGNKNNNSKLNLITNGCRKMVFQDDLQGKKITQPVKLNNIPGINKENPKVVMTDRSQQTCFVQSNIKASNSKPPVIPLQFILKPDSSGLQLAQVACNPIENVGYNKSTIGELKKNMKTPVFVNSFSKGCKLITTIPTSSSTITKALPVTVVVSKTVSTPKSAVTTVASGSSPISVISTRSIYEENYAKFIQTSSVQNRGKTANPAIVRAVIQNSQVGSATSKFSIVPHIAEPKEEKPMTMNKFVCSSSIPLKNTELKKPFTDNIECTSVKPEVHTVKFIPKNVIVADNETKRSGENNYLFIRPSTTNSFSMSSISSTSNKNDGSPTKGDFEKTTTLTSNEQVDNSTLEQLREFDLVLEQVKERSTIGKCPIKDKDQFEKKESPSNVIKSNQVAVINQINPQLLPKINLITRRNPKDKTNEIIYATACPTVSEENLSSVQPQSIQKQAVHYHKVDWAFLQKTPLLVVANSLSPIAASVSSPPKLKTTNQQNIQSVISTEKLTNAVETVNFDMTQTATTTVKSKTTSKLAFLPAKQSGSNVLGMQSQQYPQKTSKPQEDEQTVQRIYDILAEYAEQLRNSPDLNNKPAPRRRSNPVSSGSLPANSKKRKILQQKSNENGGVSTNDSEQLIDSEDSSCATTSSICNRSPFHDTISTSYDGIITQDSTPSTLSFSYHSPTEQKVETKTNSYVRAKTTSDKCVESGLEHKPATILFPSKYFVPVNFIKTEPSNVTIPTSTVSIVSNSSMVTEGNSNLKNGKIVNTVTTFVQSNSNTIVANPEKNERIIADNPTNGKVVYAGRTVNPAFKIIELTAPFKSLATQSTGSVINLNTSPDKNGQKKNFTLTTNDSNQIVTSVIKTKQNLNMNSPQIVRPTMPIVKIAVADPSLIPSIPISRAMAIGDNLQNTQKMTISSLAALDEYKSDMQSKEISKSEENLKDIKFQESLDDDYKDLGVDQPSTSELFPDADLLFEPNSSTTDPNEDDEPKSALMLKKPSVILKNDVNFKKVYSTTGVATSPLGSNKINENDSKMSLEDDDSNLVSKLSCDFDSIVNETDVSVNSSFTMQDDDMEYLPSTFSWNDCYSSIDDTKVKLNLDATTDKKQNVKTIVNGANTTNFRFVTNFNKSHSNSTCTPKKSKDGLSATVERKRKFLPGNCYKKDDEVVGKRMNTIQTIDAISSDKSAELPESDHNGGTSVLNINKKRLITKQKISTIQKLPQMTENKSENRSFAVIKTKVEPLNNTLVAKQTTNNISDSIAANSKLVNVVSIGGNGNRQVPKIFKSISVRNSSDLANKTTVLSNPISSNTAMNDQPTRHILITTNPHQQPLKFLNR